MKGRSIRRNNESLDKVIEMREAFQGKNRFWYLIGYETRRRGR